LHAAGRSSKCHGGPSGERQSPFSLQHPIQCVRTFGLGSRIHESPTQESASSELGFPFGPVQKDRADHVGVIFSIKRVQDLGQFKRSVGIRNKNDNSRAMSQADLCGNGDRSMISELSPPLNGEACGSCELSGAPPVGGLGVLPEVSLERPIAFRSEVIVDDAEHRIVRRDEVADRPVAAVDQAVLAEHIPEFIQGWTVEVEDAEQSARQ
jgi:hypothetical protein